MGSVREKIKQKVKEDGVRPTQSVVLTLVRLKLNLRVVDLAYRFGISTGLVSSYFITWPCFMYKQFSDIDWTPSIEQVAGTLLSKFKEKYPTTYSIIDTTVNIYTSSL